MARRIKTTRLLRNLVSQLVSASRAQEEDKLLHSRSFGLLFSLQAGAGMKTQDHEQFFQGLQERKGDDGQDSCRLFFYYYFIVEPTWRCHQNPFIVALETVPA